MNAYGNDFEVGDRVSMSRLFLDKIGVFGQRVTGAVGTITNITDISAFETDKMAVVKWDNGFKFFSNGPVFRTCNLVHANHLDERGVDYDTCDTFLRY